MLVISMQATILLAGCDNTPFDNKRFAQKTWIANPVNNGKHNNLRMEMSEDVMKNHLKKGMTRQQARKLLGKPDFFNSYCYGKNECEGYSLGEYVLTLDFDSTGKLIKMDIVSV
jgi:outer membrane protein assembly factor BamE (lipoprotein component of BamABCDE complex)